jgi:hypothetical protein
METYEHEDICIMSDVTIDDFTAGRIVQKLEDDDFYLAGASRIDVYDEESVDIAIADIIKKDVYSLTPTFLSLQTDIPIVVFEALMKLGKDSNEAIVAIIDATCGMCEFAEAVVAEDGRGHLLSGFDGAEKEIVIDMTCYYVFRN